MILDTKMVRAAKDWAAIEIRRQQVESLTRGTGKHNDNDNHLASSGPLPPIAGPAVKSGSFYIGADSAIFQHAPEGDKLILAPKSVPVAEKRHLADTSEKRADYLRLSLMIRMRDSVKALMAAPEQPQDESSLRSDWGNSNDQKEKLKTLYAAFQHSFGPIHQPSSGQKQTPANLRLFVNDPDVHFLSAIESINPETQIISPGIAFSGDSAEIAAHVESQKENPVYAGPEKNKRPAPAPQTAAAFTAPEAA